MLLKHSWVNLHLFSKANIEAKRFFRSIKWIELIIHLNMVVIFHLISLDNGAKMSPKRWTPLSLVFYCICLSKSLLIKFETQSEMQTFSQRWRVALVDLNCKSADALTSGPLEILLNKISLRKYLLISSSKKRPVEALFLTTAVIMLLFIQLTIQQFVRFRMIYVRSMDKRMSLRTVLTASISLKIVRL